MSAPAPRTHVVRAPKVTRELGAVLRAIVAIGFGTAIAMTAKLGADNAGADGRARSATSARLALRPNQVAFAELPAADQRMFRRCLEGLAAAEEIRSQRGSWPDVGELAAAGAPPFSADPIDDAGYRWQRLLDGTLVNYLGVPADPASPRPTILVIALEPDPGTPMDPAATVDENHHKLRDGTLLHVSISLGKARTLGRPIAMPAFEDGWRQVVVSTPHTR
jgi:hypothetical protein